MRVAVVLFFLYLITFAVMQSMTPSKVEEGASDYYTKIVKRFGDLYGQDTIQKLQEMNTAEQKELYNYFIEENYWSPELDAIETKYKINL